MDKLAIHGGTPVISHQLPHYSSIGDREMNAVAEVIRSGNLSGFYGSWGDEFFGGPVVKQFEKEWVTHFSVKHAVSVNSATSGLFAAMGAVGIRPGDEVIVPPYSMSATAMAPLVYGGIPVFADIEAETFCLDPESVRANITEKTKAIIAVNLFGHPAALAELRTLADQHGVMLVEDNAQSPLATENDRYAGTIGHVGVFSLNYHKHIHTGEGGMCVTDNDDLCLRLQMIRNHAENIVEPLNISNPINMVGFNYRMTEMSAAVGFPGGSRGSRGCRLRLFAGTVGTSITSGLSALTRGCSVSAVSGSAKRWPPKDFLISVATFVRCICCPSSKDVLHSGIILLTLRRGGMERVCVRLRNGFTKRSCSVLRTVCMKYMQGMLNG